MPELERHQDRNVAEALQGQNLRQNFGRGKASAWPPRGTLECKWYLRVVPNRSKGDRLSYVSCQSIMGWHVNSQSPPVVYTWEQSGPGSPGAVLHSKAAAVAMGTESTWSWRGAQKMYRDLTGSGQSTRILYHTPISLQGLDYAPFTASLCCRSHTWFLENAVHLVPQFSSVTTMLPA